MMHQRPAVGEVAVIGLPNPKRVEAVTKVFVLKAGQVLSERDMIAHCNAHMAHFKCPKRVMRTDVLPKNPSGKLLKRQKAAQSEDVLN